MARSRLQDRFRVTTWARFLFFFSLFFVPAFLGLGDAGQVPLRTAWVFFLAAFFGLGAYAGAVSQGQGVPMYLAWGIGAGLAAIFATGLGLAILRLRGHYFAIASLVVADVLREIVNSTTNLTGGGMGLNLPVLKLGVDAQAKLFYYCMLGIALLTIFTAAYVMRRPLGFGLGCIKQNEDAANIIGINDLPRM